MKPLLGLALALAMLFTVVDGARAAEFSADIVRTADGQAMPGGKAYIANGKIRMETSMGGQDQVMITDLAAGKAYMLQPSAKLCMEMALDPRRAGPEALKDGASDLGQWRTVGRETVDGFECEKRVFDYKNPSGGEMTAWFADKLGHPIKSVVKEGGRTMTMEYKNIKTGAQSAELFSVPAGYQRMSMPGMGAGAPAGKTGMPGQMPGQKPGQMPGQKPGM